MSEDGSRLELERQVRIALQRAHRDERVIAGICDWLDQQDLPRLGGVAQPELQNDRLESRADRMERQTAALGVALDTLRHKVTKAGERKALRAAIKDAAVVFGISAAVVFAIVASGWVLAGLMVAHHL